MKLGLLQTCLTIDEVNRDDLNQLVILPAGVVELYGMDSLLVDKEAADAIIAAFEDQGVDVPIDFEHAAVVKAEHGEPAPAAAWITSLSWVEGKGLIADVEWATVEARDMVLSGQYKYLSPIVLVDPDTGRPLVLHSAALTNKPRIKNQKQLLSVAASVSLFSGITRKDNMMTIKGSAATKGDPPAWIQKVQDGCLKRVAMQASEPVAGVEVEEGVVQDQAMLEELGAIVENFKEILIAWDVALDPEADAITTLNAVGDLLVKLYEATASAEDAAPVEDIAQEVAASGPDPKNTPPAPPAAIASSIGVETQLCDKLGLKRGTPLKAILSTVQTMKGHVGYVSAGEHNKLSVRLAKIEGEANAKNVDGLVQYYCSAHKLNLHDAAQMKWAREFAGQDPEGFKTIMASAPAIVPTGQEVVVMPTSDEGKNGRQKVIALALSSYGDNPRMASMVDAKGWVNGELRDAQQPELTAKELTELVM